VRDLDLTPVRPGHARRDSQKGGGCRRPAHGHRDGQ
jgi:hypothetical protein